jgi:uncharacterized LabA/DUF88 family protein
MSGKRAMIFVDAQNLVFGAKGYGEREGGEYQIDPIALREHFADGRDVIRAYWFDSFPTEEQIDEIVEEDGEKVAPSDKRGFFYMLNMNGFRVDAKPLRRRDEGFVEKGADIGLATELVAQGFRDSYAEAIVVTGDSDFSQAIRYVQDQGKYVMVAAFDANSAGDIKKTADEYVKLDAIAEQIRR